ncbi:tautomerase family protein [Bradyrhizobium prioriisuperbiae]|uniref:tautomerase family protein n=1 Tax=Bradyrhizobium prioriisuperbiae TaxID=2854389 RepID=UPI0028E9813F|nr:tautomerase family protein [Bradyrhizobium prioritasuperba]
MPTYVCTSHSGVLSPEQRARISRRLTEIHHEVAVAPRYFVQVIFNDLSPHSHYIGGDEAGPGQIWIRADIRSGRTQEQKAKLLTRIIDAVSEISGSSREDVWVYISDIPGQSVAEFGHILPSPGEEEVWFAGLPSAIQDKLRSRA